MEEMEVGVVDERRALAEIIEGGNDDEAFDGIVQGEPDIAKIGVRDVLQLGQRAGGPDADHGTTSVKFSEDGFDGFGRIGGTERHVDGGKNPASQWEEMRGEDDAIFRPARAFEDFPRVSMGKKIIGLEIFVDLDEVEIATGIFAGAASSGLAIADHTAAAGDEAGFG